MMHSWKLKTAGDGGVGIKRRGRRGGCGGRPDNAYTECVCCLTRCVQSQCCYTPKSSHAAGVEMP